MTALAIVVLGCVAVWAVTTVLGLHHTLAYFNTTAGTLALSDSPAVDDGWATITNNHFIMQEDMDLRIVLPFADTITRCQLNLPHWRFVSQPEIVPVLQDWDDAQQIVAYDLAPKNLTVNRIDELQALVSTSATATDGVLTALFLKPKMDPLTLPGGDVYPTRFTASISGVAGQWARGNITFTQSLPAGNYAVLGMDVQDADSQLARLRFQKYEMLPGVPVRNAVTGIQMPQFRNGRFGVFGTFANTAQPSLEIFSASGSASAQVGVMDLVKLS